MNPLPRKYLWPILIINIYSYLTQQWWVDDSRKTSIPYDKYDILQCVGTHFLWLNYNKIRIKQYSKNTTKINELFHSIVKINHNCAPNSIENKSAFFFRATGARRLLNLLVPSRPLTDVTRSSYERYIRINLVYIPKYYISITLHRKIYYSLSWQVPTYWRIYK